MFSRKTLVADLLFWVQIVLASWFSIPQFFSLILSVEGQSLSMQFVILGFLLLNLSLAFNAWRKEPVRGTAQLVIIYVMWVFYVFSNIIAIFINGRYVWSVNDYITCYSVGTGTLIILSFCYWKKLGLKQPITKGLLAINFKAVPQIMMAMKIISEGGKGIPLETIIVGNIGVLLRIYQIIAFIRKGDRKWLLVGEISNEITWAIVSIAWFGWFLKS